MLTVKRIGIKEGQGHCGDKVYPFISEVLHRRYGNAVTFAFDFELQDIMDKIKEAGFTPYDDNFSFSISEPEDYEIGKTVYCEGFFANVAMVVKETYIDNEGHKIAKVKYQAYPRKRALLIYAKTKEQFESEVLKSVGLGGLEAINVKV